MVTLARVDADDRRLSRLLQLYLHEWSALVSVPVQPDGLFVYEDLALYRDSASRGAHLFLDDDGRTPIGFALTMRDQSDRWHVEEFFVIAGARRRGVGMRAAVALFELHPGSWTLTVRPENPSGLHFWRRVLGEADERVEIGDDAIQRTRLSWTTLSE